ncbi:HAMP domain-containing sensor histidine kinase [Plantactinospora sp. DSM 117369]
MIARSGPGRPPRLRGGTTLRFRLTAASALLVAVALTVMGVATVAGLHAYLLGRVDVQLRDAAARVADDLTDDRPAPDGVLLVRVPSDVVVMLVDSAGNPRSGTPAPDPAGSAPHPAGLRAAVARPNRPVTVPARSGDQSWRVLALPPFDGTHTVVVAMSLADLRRTVSTLSNVVLATGGATVLALAAAGAAIVRASLRPLAGIERTAEAIAAGDLSRRVDGGTTAATEVGRLGRALNGMLTQIESAARAREASEASARRSEERMRRFIADAGHELRTPLTVIRGFAEQLRRRGPADPDDAARVLTHIETTTERMALLVDDLLLLAALDEQRPLAQHPVDLLALVVDAVREAAVLGPDRRITLTADDGTAYLVRGDDARLRQVIGNLTSNALVHTPARTPVSVRLGAGTLAGAPAAVLEVADQGPGLAGDQAERVFERFYRVDRGRPRPDRGGGRSGGSGLGLAIVAALVAAHRGTVTVVSAPGQGATFRVTLPLAPG